MSVDAFDARLAVRAGPLLAQFNAAGVLDAADVHVAQRLGTLTRETDERVLLATALAVRAVRLGSVCVVLEEAVADATVEPGDASASGSRVATASGTGGASTGRASSPDVDEPADLPWPDPTEWRDAIARSPMVAVGVHGDAARPVRLVDGRLYLDRYWRLEQLVRTEVDDRITAPPIPVDPGRLRDAANRLFPAADDGRQRLAAATCAISRITVLTGGPGTGKTTTVARVLAVLQDVAGPNLRVALAAPTGKAAARLQEAVRKEVGEFTATDDATHVGSLDATTIHRLLGWRHGSSTRFTHDRNHRLPHDVVVIDETSMVPLLLMARLLEALRPDARLLLVGDPDQLASVEAGAVLGDLVGRPPVSGDSGRRPASGDGLPDRLRAILPDDVPEDPEAVTALHNGVVRLEKVHRFGTELSDLANAIRAGQAEVVLGLLRAGGAAIEYVETSDRPTPAQVAGIRDDVQAAGSALLAAARAGDAEAALRALELHRLVLAHRRGPAGVTHWSAVAEAWVATATATDDVAGPWPLGTPLLVTVNDRDTGLYNGDTGVVIADRHGGAVVAFGDPAAPRLIPPYRLPAVEPVHAMTIHRGQGSQFDRVSVVLPPPSSPLLTRELLYTAVTRAKERVRIVGTEAAVRAAVERPVRRASGLREPVPAS